MKKFKKKSKSTNVLEIDQNDQHYKRYFSSIYGDECKSHSMKSKPAGPSNQNSFSFQQVKHSASVKENDTNHKLNWRRLQLSRTKLKQTAKTSALFAGFAMVAIVELQFNNDPTNPVPPSLLILFGICTILLVSIHILALMIATCILPSVETIALLDSAESACESPHERLRFFIELAWTFSSVIGVFLFLAEVIILVWVKFWEIGVPNGQPGKTAALASTIAFLPFILMFFFFAIYFYRDFACNKYEKSTKQIEELESIIVRLEQNDMTYNQNAAPWSAAAAQQQQQQDSNNNLVNNLNLGFYANSGHPKRKYNNARQQQQFSVPDAPSGLLLKKLCRYEAANSNVHLLNEATRQQSVSADRIDGNELRNDHFKLENEFRPDDHTYKPKVCRNISADTAMTGDCVRFSLDNVSFATYNSLPYGQESIQNAAYFSGGGDAAAGVPAGGTTSRLANSKYNRQKAKTQKQITSQSSKSITDLAGLASPINDQQSNDSNNKMLKKEAESFSNLSTIVV